MNDTQGAVYLQTNDAERNEVVAYTRGDDGSLSYLGAYATGGRGTGEVHLPSQSSVVLSEDGNWLFVANPGSDEISLFAIDEAAPRLSDTTSSQGSRPTSIAVHGQLVFVLNNGSADIQGFEIADGKLRPLAGSKRPLSEAAADGAQIAFSPDGSTLVVTERGTNSISSYAVDARGYADGPSTIPAAGETPYGFDFTADGALVVTEAFGGDIGKACASSYVVAAPGRLERVSGSVADTRSEVCWAAVTKDGRHAYVTNFGDCTISCYRIGDDGGIELAEAVAASTRLGKAGIRDEAISSNGRFLYALDADAQKVHGWSVDRDGKLAEIGAFDGVPVTVAGLAAS
jgi:6-phosphogluconolactonase (cycloisomerase 2 family)